MFSKHCRYNSSWYNVSVKSQKLIMMVMVKCLRPSFLSAGNIYIFSLKNFVMVKLKLSETLFYRFADINIVSLC